MTAQPVDTTQRVPTFEAAWHVLDEPATIRFLPSGMPLALRWRGSIWQVIGEPVAWCVSSTLGRPFRRYESGHVGSVSCS